MDGEALKTPIAGGLKFDVMTTSMPDDDQHFLLYFITGIYFGPDLKGGRLLKSVLQRLAEKLPPYNSDQLAGSHMKMVEVERVYYYVLRKADKSLIMRIPFLDQFFQGNLPTQGHGHSARYPQFPDLFPPEFHPHSRFKNRYKIIENLSFINNPEVSYLSAEDVERFKRLTGLNDFFLDRDAARLHTSSDHTILHNVEATKNTLNKEMSPIKDAQNLLRTKLVGDPHDAGDTLQRNFVVAPLRSVPPETKSDSNPVEKSGPAMIFLPRKPAEEDWKNIVAATNRGFALTGTAAMGHVGPIIGLMDIGEGEDSYLFRVSLPGVNRDGRDFSCEIEKDGKVVIQGVTTTGERTVNKYSQVFEMLTQNLCPSGQFSLSFQLPGPVDPQRFYGNYGIDGILEGVVMKDLHK